MKRRREDSARYLCLGRGRASTQRSWTHDVVWTGQWAEGPGDQEILAFAYSEQRVLVTLDKDFGELAVLQGQPHHGIIRIVGFAARSQSEVCKIVIEQHGNDLLTGAIITAEPGRLRIRSSN